MNRLHILVIGSRHLPEKATRMVAYGLDLAAERYGADAEAATVIHGTCPGADQLAAAEAARRGWDREGHPAKWREEGRAAGPARNRRIAAAEATDRNGLIMITDTGRLRCVSTFQGQQCTHRAPHPRNHSGLHRSASGLRWTMSHDGNTPTEYLECPATWDDGRQCRDRAGHDGLHHIGGNRPNAVRWNDTRTHVTRGPLPPPEPDNGYRSEGEYQAMHLYGVKW